MPVANHSQSDTFLSDVYPRDVRQLLSKAGQLELSRGACRRLTWFEYYLTHDCDIKRTCWFFGIARSTFVRWAKRFDPYDLDSLEERSHRPHRFRESAVEESTIRLIGQLRQKDVLMNKEKISEVLALDYKIHISPSTVGRVIMRYGFYFADTPAHRRKRAKFSDEYASQPDQSLGMLQPQFGG